MTDDARPVDYDVIVVGSGFGGSVAALRLVEKGYRVAVIEAGRRFGDSDFPRTSWDVRRFLWAPRLGCFGIQRIHRLPDAFILAGAGVGGGSLVYANTLYVPPPEFFSDPQWNSITDWSSELAPYYAQASQMLGVVDNPSMTPADDAMLAVATEMGVESTFRLTPVGVFFGSDGQSTPGVTVDDPYFGGVGPARTGCTQCGECMTGCRHNAKNTLPKNYLGLAESAGAVVIPMTTVISLQFADAEWSVGVERSGSWSRRTRRDLTATHVVMAAGAYGTARLLHRMRDEGRLPELSPSLGRLTRTNSESLVGAVAKDSSIDFTTGVAITSSFHPDPRTHVEPVRYGRGSNSMSLLGTALTDEEPTRPRWRSWLGEIARKPSTLNVVANSRHWSERTVIALVMQSLDNSIVVSGTRTRLGRWRLTSRQSQGTPNPTWIPAANEVARRLAVRLGGLAFGNVGEVVGAPFTAHLVGGAVIGDSPSTGVVDAYHRAYGYPTLHVVDGSAIAANLGVNPALTITAQAERAFALWPNKGDVDPRPPMEDASVHSHVSDDVQVSDDAHMSDYVHVSDQVHAAADFAHVSDYVHVDPVPPNHPVVPDRAPAALVLPG